MTKTSCERFCLPGPMRWLHAGGDLAQPSGIHQCAHRASLRSERPPKSLMHSPELPYVRTRSSNPVAVTSIIELGAGIKSP
jgi:hypothetical protein